MKTKFNDFLLEYMNNTHAEFTLNELIDKLQPYYSNLRNLNQYSDDAESDIDTCDYIYYEITKPTKYKRYYSLEINSNLPEYKKSKLEKLLEIYKNKVKNMGVIFSYELTTSHLYVFYKEQFVKRIKTPKYVYHSSDKSNLNDILHFGLIPKPLSISSEFKTAKNLDYPDAVFVTDANNIWHNYSNNAIFRIDTTKIDNKFFEDMNIPGGNYYVTFDKIPTSAIELVNNNTLLPN